jgi:flagellar assembly protein FliH
MKATLIPKELLTAYERWEMESFDEKPAVEEFSPAHPPIPAGLTAEDILRLKERSWQEGYEAGMEQGYNNGHQQGYEDGLTKGYSESQLQGWEYGYNSGREKGHEEGHQEGHKTGLETGHQVGFDAGRALGETQINAIIAQLNAITSSLTQEVKQASDGMAEPMLALAMDISKAVLKTALEIRPALIIPLIKDAIKSLPSLQLPLHLYLHPEDATLVTTHMQDELTQQGWELIESPDIARGACRIETGANQIDASLETRWKHIAETLHQHNDWLV